LYVDQQLNGCRRRDGVTGVSHACGDLIRRPAFVGSSTMPPCGKHGGTSSEHAEFATTAGNAVVDQDYSIDLSGDCLASRVTCDPSIC
jgi:hypothetical protein